MSHLPKLQIACRRATNLRPRIIVHGPRYYEYEEPTGEKDAFYTYRVVLITNGIRLGKDRDLVRAGSRYVEIDPETVAKSDQNALDELVLSAVDAAVKEIEGGNSQQDSTPTKELDSN